MKILLRMALICCMVCAGFRSFSQQGKLATESVLTGNGMAGFVRNVGQIRSVEKNALVSGVYFVFNSADATIYITQRGLSYVYAKRLRQADKQNGGSAKSISADTGYYEMERVDAVLNRARIDSANVEITYCDNPVRFNYYNGDIAATNQRLIKKIIFKNIYKGVNWVVSCTSEGTKDKLTSDFIVDGPGQLEDISIQYSKNARLSVNSDQSLSVTSKMGFIKETRPVGFNGNDRRKKVSMSYRVSGNCIGFKTVGPVKYPLIVDPDLYWGTMLHAMVPFSGNRSVVATGSVVTDTDGNIYTVASCSGPTNFPTVNPGNGAYYSSIYNSASGNNAYLKFNEKGVLLWFTYFAVGGSSGGIAIDSKNNLIASSLFSGGALPYKDIGGYFDSARHTGQKSYLAKFDPSGALIWCSQWGPDNSLHDITTDQEENFYITGDGQPPVRVDPGGAYMNTSNYFGNAPYIAKFDKNCRLVWSTEIRGGDVRGESRIAVDKKRNLYLLKHSVGAIKDYPMVNAGGYFNTKDFDPVITKFDASLKMVWSSRVPSGGDVEVDTACNVYIIGAGGGGLFFPYVDPGNGAYQDAKRNGGGYATGAICKFDESTNLIWSTTFDASKNFFFSRIVYEKFRNQVHIYGYMNDYVAGLPTRNDDCNGSYYVPSTTLNNLTDPLMVSFTAGGRLAYASLNKFPYQNYEYADFTVDGKGNLIYVFGHLGESDFGPSGAFSALKDPGKGAYYEQVATNNYVSTASAIMKLTPSTLGVTSVMTPSSTCACSAALSVTPTCGSGNYSYLWNTGATTSTLTNVCAGEYSVTVIDLNNNSRIVIPFSLPNPPGNINAAVLQVNDDHCNSEIGSVNVGALTGGPSPFLFSFNGQPFSSVSSFQNVKAGVYQVSIKDNAGCQLNRSVTVRNIPGPAKLFATVMATACDRPTGLIVIDSIGGGVSPFTYAINNISLSGSKTFTALGDGVYTITAKDSAGCILTESVTLKKQVGATAAVPVADNGQCGQTTGTITLTNLSGGTKPFLYSLDNVSYSQDSMFQHLVEGKHYLYAKDANGCLYKDSALLNLRVFPSFRLPSDTVLCDHASYTVNVTQPKASYLWEDGQTSPTRTLKMAGSYTVKVVNDDNCTISKTLNITTQQTPDNATDKIVSQCVEDTLHIDIFFPDASYLWQDGKTTPTYEIFAPGLYAYKITNFCGSSSGSIKVSTHTCICDVRIPNIFSPNGDGINDRLIPAYECTPASYRLIIYNRGGQQVFSTRDPLNTWDGLLNGVALPIGTYYYILKIKGLSDPVERERTGSITLIR